MADTLYDFKQALRKPESISSTSPEESLDNAFSDGDAFVYDSSGRFCGIVSIAQALFRTRRTLGSKVKSSMVNPPHITLHTSIGRVAEGMISNDIEILPVFKSEAKEADVQYAVEAKRLLRECIKKPEILSMLIQELREDPATTIPQGASLREAYEHIRRHRNSKKSAHYSQVLLVDDNGKLEGVLERVDIEPYLLKPTTKQQTMPSEGSLRAEVYGKETRGRLTSTKARSIAKRNVLAISEDAPKEEIIKRLLGSSQDGIVLLDSAGKPKGIVSIYSLLRALVSAKESEVTSVDLTMRNDANLAQGDLNRIEGIVRGKLEKLHKRTPLRSAEIRVKEAKNKAGRPTMFEVLLETFLVRGGKFVAEAKQKDLIPAVQEAIQEIEQQDRHAH